MSINIPAITSFENALKIYYTHAELGNKEIKALFGSRSPSTVARLKALAKDEMVKRDMSYYGMYKVNTSIAFAVWGIDVMDLEKRMKKIRELKL